MTEIQNTVSNGSVHPLDELKVIANNNGLDMDDVKFARLMDERDPLRHLRGEFCYPKMGDILHTDHSIVNPSDDCVYLCGNSLGLCPKKTKEYVNVEVDKWANLGVQGHTNGDLPWAWCDEVLEEDMARIVGCQREEVSIMNGLTVNLHLLLISFYRPNKDRYKILCESKAFPSDHYAFESQSKLHGYDPKDVMVCMEPREGEFNLQTEDILSKINEEGEKIAVVCFSGVQYYTGQLFDIPTITKAGKAKGCYVGWDLAHAAGNVPLDLHNWGVDFACWCTYKYLNASAGGLAALFIHETYRDNNFPRLMGWWGHDMSTRFLMDNNMDLIPGARGYRISNTPGFLCSPLKASLEIFNKTSLTDLRRKSLLLTAYLESRILQTYKRPDGKDTKDDGDNIYIDIFTPQDPEQRGAQLSLAFNVSIQEVFKELEKRGVLCDKRYPRVIRISPVPMYCSFEDVHRFMGFLKDALAATKTSLIHVTTTLTI
uniref:Kynureninase n=1 Tax=Arion vulgaris TaxID=1028688 RepID=A0A0B6ZK02_9EUPU